MKNKIFICITFILLPVMLAGCWNRRELNTLAVVQAMGIDKTEDGKLSITIQILKPGNIKGAENGGGVTPGGKGVLIVTSTGETVFDAIRNATTEADRKLYFPHNRVIVIGEEAARSGIAPLLDFIDRDPEPRLRPYVFIAKGKAKDILEGEHEQEKIPAKAIEDLAKGTIATSNVQGVELYELFKVLASKSSDPFLPGIKITKDEEDGDGDGKQLIKLHETAIFKGDKLTGWFDGRETRGLLWVLGKVKSGIIVVKSPLEETKNVSLEIIRASSKVRLEMADGKLLITIEVKEEGNLAEQMSHVDLTKPDTFAELEKRQAAAIREEINAALDKAQKEWGVDIFKFGEEVHRKLPRDWKELKKKWAEEFKNVEVKIEVEAKLRRIGMTTKPD